MLLAGLLLLAIVFPLSNPFNFAFSIIVSVLVIASGLMTFNMDDKKVKNDISQE